ncbi:hypothetical protein [Amycolatopsis magusensis]|uniref:hypothetical protein n=1 Tax=Amycolatopsis magusensis TaxID=882444 RepID=UPI003C2FFAED
MGRGEAETAFTTGFQAAAMVSGASALVLAALRHLRPAELAGWQSGRCGEGAAAVTAIPSVSPRS